MKSVKNWLAVSGLCEYLIKQSDHTQLYDFDLLGGKRNLQLEWALYRMVLRLLMSRPAALSPKALGLPEDPDGKVFSVSAGRLVDSGYKPSAVSCAPLNLSLSSDPHHITLSDRVTPSAYLMYNVATDAVLSVGVLGPTISVDTEGVFRLMVLDLEHKRSDFVVRITS